MAVVNEVITEFAFSGSTQPLNDYNRDLSRSIGLLASAAAGIVAAAGAMTAFVTSTTAALDPMIQLARSTGVAVESIQELGFAASVSGSDAQALQSSVSGLAEKIGEAAQKGSEEFARLGINVRDVNGDVKSADQVLLELGDRFDALNLSLSEQRSFAQALGIDPSLVQLLGKTGAEIDALRQRARELGVVTEAEADAAVRLNDAVTTLRFGFEGVKNSIAVGLAPEIESITEGFVDFLAANKDVISEGVERVIEVTVALAESVVRLTPIIATLTAGFVAWKVASIGLGTILGAIFSPVVLITAGIAALLLIVDDLIVGLDGGQSVVADFFNEFFGIDIVPPLRAALDAFKGFLSDFLSAGAVVFDTFAELFSGVFDLLRGDLDGAAGHFTAFFDSVVGIFTGGFAQLLGEASRFGGLIGDNVVDPIRETFEGLFDWIASMFSGVTEIASDVAGFFGFGDSAPSGAPDVVNGDVPVMSQQRLVPQPQTTNNQRSVTIEQSNQFNLPPGTDRGTADRVAGTLQSQLDDAETQLTVGGF